MYPLAPGILLITAALAGCGGSLPMASGSGGVDTEAAGAGIGTVSAQTPVEPPPRWRSTNEVVTPDAIAPEHGPGQPLYDLGDPASFRAQVQTRCEARSAEVTETEHLRIVVAELYADGAAPGPSADALIRADCGGVADIVRELVAQGGEAAVAPVVDRTLLLVGPGAEGLVEGAVSAGLGRDPRGTVPSGTDQDGGALRYAMAYFPVGGDGDLEQSDSLSRLFGTSRPGYGLYTYVIAGSDISVSPQAFATYRELLRVIETYVLAARDGGGPDPSAHTFLVPVRPERHGAALVDQTGPELSAPMGEALVRYLGGRGRADLVRRLETSPGPFLVTSLEPSLTPREQGAPQLLVDLGSVGPAYMYSVVDAYDRPIPAGETGRQASLDAVRGRLLDLFPEPVVAGDADIGETAPGDWVFLLGPRQVAGAADAATLAAPAPDTDGAP